MPEVDLVIGHGISEGLPAILAEREAGLLPGKILWTAAVAAGTALHGFASPFASPAGSPVELDATRTRAFLKIQDGCERRCAFCIVPFLRGPERSASAHDVEAEIRRLAREGVAEVVLAGVHLANYGRERGTDLLDLLRRLEDDPPACRVRLSSLEPMEAGRELVTFVSRSRVVVPHLHLPLQSGSDTVLRRMRRGLVTARYRELVETALGLNPRVHIATDVIVGFPGETHAEFEETVGLLTDLPLASLHVFPFSPRTGTLGAELHKVSAVEPRILSSRAGAIRELGRAKLASFRERADGTLADTVVLRGGTALTDNYLEAELGDLEREELAPGARFQARLSLRPGGRRLIARRIAWPSPKDVAVKL